MHSVRLLTVVSYGGHTPARKCRPTLEADPPLMQTLSCRQIPRCRPSECKPPGCRPPWMQTTWSCDLWCMLGSHWTVNRMRDKCQNIILPQPPFAGGKNWQNCRVGVFFWALMPPLFGKSFKPNWVNQIYGHKIVCLYCKMVQCYNEVCARQKQTI